MDHGQGVWPGQRDNRFTLRLVGLYKQEFGVWSFGKTPYFCRASGFRFHNAVWGNFSTPCDVKAPPMQWPWKLDVAAITTAFDFLRSLLLDW